MVNKQYKVTDTNIFLLDAKEALYSFKPKKPDRINTIVIPFVVLEEIDKYKSELHTSRGYNARKFGNELKKIIQQNKQSIDKPIQIGERYFVQIVSEYDKTMIDDLPQKLNLSKNDNVILAIAHSLKEKQEGGVELITNDTNLFLKGSALGLVVNDWKDARSINNYKEIYKGWREMVLEKEDLESLISSKTPTPIENVNIENPIPNEYFAFKISEDYEIHSFKNKVPNTRDFALAIYLPEISGLENGGLVRIPLRAGADSGVLGIKARNYEQSFALDALLRKNIRQVNLIGPAGTGKTLLSIASGLHQLKTTENTRDKTNIYETVGISRPVISMGDQQLGFLPGNISEKMGPWLNAIFDNIKPDMKEKLINKISKSPDERKDLKKMKPSDLRGYLTDNEIVEIEPLEHIRGRSLDDKFLLIDESQNLDPLETKTIITRAGTNTKVVMTGDPQQIDKQGLNELTNGLCYSSERLKNENITATVFLSKGERSKLATLASRLL